MLTVTAFKLRDDPAIYDAMTGHPLPANYDGYCQVFFTDGEPMIFHTGINQYDERYWWAMDNKPHKECVFASYVPA